MFRYILVPCPTPISPNYKLLDGRGHDLLMWGLRTEHAEVSTLHTHPPWHEVGGRRVSWTPCLVWRGSNNDFLFRRDTEGKREVPKSSFWRSPTYILDNTPLLPLRLYHNGVQLLLMCKWKKHKALIDISDDPPSSNKHWESIMHHASSWTLVNTTDVVSWNSTGRWRHYISLASRQKQPCESPWKWSWNPNCTDFLFSWDLGQDRRRTWAALPKPGLVI